jgi:uncharacterized membrane protein YphA (DoxX/SURF4 family)
MTVLQRFIDNHWVMLAFRLILAAMFLISAYGKLVNLEEYSVAAIYNFQLVPIWLARPAGYILPFIELACALGILFGVLTRLSAYGIAAMSVVFFGAKMIVEYVQHRIIYCGCFGAVMDTFATETKFLDIPIFLIALGVIFSNSRYWLAIGGLLPEGWRDKLRLVW